MLLSAPADKKTSRVPRYQNGEKLSGTAIFRVKSPHIGGDLERVDVSFVLSLRQRKDRVPGRSPDRGEVQTIRAQP